MSAIRAYQVKDYGQIPVPEDERIQTDFFCTICSSIFAIVMFIVAIACLNTQNLNKMTYPNDIEGNLCGWDAQDYKILYYTTESDPTKRLCVKTCPKAGDKQLECFATPNLSCSPNSNPKYQVNIYDTEMVHNRLGVFCMPTDQQQRNKVEQMTGMYTKNRFLSTYDAIWNCLWIGVIFGCIFCVLVQYFPTKVFAWSYLLGGIIFIITGIVTLVLAEGSIIFKLLVGIFLVVLGVLILYNLADNERRRQIVIGGRLLQCATQAYSYKKIMLVYIPIFIVLFMGLVFLIAFQLLAFWSNGKLIFVQQNPFYEIKGFVSSLFSFFSLIEFLWGMSFLKESFNFIVSGYATDWYYYRNENEDQITATSSLTRLMKYHWGSVVGGSFMLQFFYVIDLVGDYFFPTDTQKRARGNHNQIHRVSSMNSSSAPNKKSNFTGQTVSDPRKLGKCCEFLNLVRSQSMGYINIVSIPYCNASRYCEMLAEDSQFYDRSQTTNRLYRISAHAILIALTCLISISMSKNHSGGNHIMGVLFCFGVSLFIVTYFVSFHSDISEGLLVSVFVQEKVRGVDRLERAPQCVSKLYDDDIDGYVDGQAGVTDLLI